MKKAQAQTSSQAGALDRRKNFVPGIVLIFALAFAVYWPALHGEYLWDDAALLTENPLVLKSDGLKDIWFSTKPYDYFPLTLTTFWLEWRLWGADSLGYHVTNVFLQALGGVLLWLVLRRLKIPGAFLASLIFTVHPVCVASVAWIAERKNVLSLVFFLLSILCFLRSEPENDPAAAGKSRFTFHVSGRYLLSILFFLLALLSKTSVVMLPVILLGLAWWQRGVVMRSDIARTVPFFLLSLVLGLVTVWFQANRAIGDAVSDPLLVRVLGGGYAVWFYLLKALMPVKLAMIYPRWEINPASVVSYLPWLLWVCAFVALWRFRASWGRPLLFALGYFFITLAPVLGVFNMSFFEHSRVSDHLQHISLIGVVAMIAAVVTTWIKRKAGEGRMVLSVAPIVLLLAALAFQRAQVFATSENLWRDSISVNPKAWGAHNNLGLALGRQGKRGEAIECYRQALMAKSDYPYAHNNLGLALADEKKFDEAMRHYTAALQKHPKYPEAHNNLGNALLETGKLGEAIERYQTAIKLKPNFPLPYNNLGYALSKQGKLDEAIAYYRTALQLDPKYTYACNNLGRTLAMQGKYAQAVEQHRIAFVLDPNYIENRYHLANALSELGQLDEAVEHFSAVLRLKPDHVEACNGIGIALAMKDNMPEGIRWFERALQLSPTNTSALSNLGNAFAQQRKWDQAAQKFRAALNLEPNDAVTLANLGNVLQEQGKFPEAIQQYLAALKIEPSNPQLPFLCGVASLRQNKPVAAADYFTQALRLKPDFAAAKQQLDLLTESSKN